MYRLFISRLFVLLYVLINCIAVCNCKHEILITKMEHYGITNLESKWFKSYLSDRKQYVEFNNTQSATEIITTGVPQ